MPETTLCVAALLDEQTTQFVQALRQWLAAQGFGPDGMTLPPHLQLAGYPVRMAQDVQYLVRDAAAKTRGFAFRYSHVGLSSDGLTIFLAPEVNRPMLTLRERFLQQKGWLLHTPLLTLPAPAALQAMPYILTNVKPFEARVTALAVCRMEDGAVLSHLPL